MGRKTKHSYSAAERSKIMTYVTGHTAMDAAKKFNIPVATIYGWGSVKAANPAFVAGVRKLAKQVIPFEVTQEETKAPLEPTEFDAQLLKTLESMPTPTTGKRSTFLAPLQKDMSPLALRGHIRTIINHVMNPNETYFRLSMEKDANGKVLGVRVTRIK